MILRPIERATPDVTVVVPTLPEHDHERLVGALEAQTHAAFEVVLVEDAELDVCEARNAGIRAARAPTIAFTDDDCVPPPGWVGRVAQRFTADPVALLEGPIRGGRPERALYQGEGLYLTANLAVRTEIAHAVGGFRSAFAAWGEDTDFGWRVEDLVADGPLTCEFDRRLVMHHPDPMRTGIDPEAKVHLATEHPVRFLTRMVGTNLLPGRGMRWLE